MKKRHCPTTGDKRNPADVPGFLWLQVYRVIVLRGQASLLQVISDVHEVTVGAGLLAKAMYQATSMLIVPPSSRASPLPHGLRLTYRH